MNDTLPETSNPASHIQCDIPPRPAWLKRKPTKTTEAAERAAHKFGVDPAQVLALMPEAHGLLKQQIETIERAKARARQLTGLDARIIASRENRYLDHSTHTRFDETSRELAAEHPELGFDPDGHDTPQRVWQFIAEGKQPIPVRHSDCVAELAAQWCEQLEHDDFPDDADGFDPSELEVASPDATSFDPAYVAGTTRILTGISSSENPACDVQPERIHHADATASRDVSLSSSRDCPPRGDGSGRKATRPHPGSVALPGVRSDGFARPLVSPLATGRDPGHREAAGRATPRLGRVQPSHPAYAAGSGLPAWIRGRDGPVVIRYPVSVV